MLSITKQQDELSTGLLLLLNYISSQPKVLSLKTKGFTSKCSLNKKCSPQSGYLWKSALLKVLFTY